MQRTTAINKLLSLKKRKKVIQGGTWGGKTYGIIATLVDFAAKNPNRDITIVAETIPAIKGGALKDFKDIMQSTNRWIEDRYNATDRVYTFANKTTIQFNSFESVGKAQAAGKRDDLFINEAPYIPFEIADALMGRTSGNIWIDFNPTHEFWAHTEIIGQPDCDFIILNYKDNEALPYTILHELLLKQEKAKTSQYWANWCKVYIDGEIGNLEGAIFKDWKLINELPTDARLLGIGLDFGYTNDPTAAIAVYKYDNRIIVDELIYQTGLLNAQIYSLLKDFRCKIVADSAEPKSIAELKLRGLNIQPAIKGQGSIMSGITIVNENFFEVTARSSSIIKELRGYIYEKDKNGKPTNSPIDNYNHAMDAMRYIFSSLFEKRKVFKGHKPL
jgi:phage terminase large subunit